MDSIEDFTVRKILIKKFFFYDIKAVEIKL